MNKLLMLFAVAALTACASQDEKDDPREDPVTEAVLDFIDVRDLEEVDAIKSGSSDSWTELNLEYLVYEGRRETYLVEFARKCHELQDRSRITPDKRWDTNHIRARFDTIRGCRIHRVFKLTEAEVTELKNIGETPGSRN